MTTCRKGRDHYARELWEPLQVTAYLGTTSEWCWGDISIIFSLLQGWRCNIQFSSYSTCSGVGHLLLWLPEGASSSCWWPTPPFIYSDEPGGLRPCTADGGPLLWAVTGVQYPQVFRRLVCSITYFLALEAAGPLSASVIARAVLHLRTIVSSPLHTETRYCIS